LIAEKQPYENTKYLTIFKAQRPWNYQ